MGLKMTRKTIKATIWVRKSTEPYLVPSQLFTSPSLKMKI